MLIILFCIIVQVLELSDRVTRQIENIQIKTANHSTTAKTSEA
jgi:hypothetical protein